MPTEAEFEASPEAVAGRARLEAGLKHLEAAELEAFWEAVRRCYGGGTQEAESQQAGTQEAGAHEPAEL